MNGWIREGIEVRTEGDSFFAVFESAVDAALLGHRVEVDRVPRAPETAAADAPVHERRVLLLQQLAQARVEHAPIVDHLRAALRQLDQRLGRHRLHLLPEDVASKLQQAGIDPRRRAQALSLEEWARVTRALAPFPLRA